VDAARCISGRVVKTFSLSELNDPNFGKDHPAAQTRVQQIAAACR
jgi:hypothetical protein